MSIKANPTAEVFWLAFKNLDPETQDKVIERITKDERFREELFDAALVEERKNDSVRDFEDYASEAGE